MSDETKTVDFGGVTLTLPAAEADALIAERDKQKAAQRESQQRLAQMEAKLGELGKAKDDEKKALERKTLEEKGAYDEALAKLRAEHETKMAQLASGVVSGRLSTAIASHPDLLRYSDDAAQKTLVADIAQQISNRCQYDADTGDVRIRTADGSGLEVDANGPVKLDSFIGSWLEQRPHLRAAKNQPGSKGAPGGPGASSKDNPWTSGNMTKQAEIIAKDKSLAQRLAAEAGKTIPKALLD